MKIDSGKLKDLRVSRGFSQVDLAHAACVKQSNISAVERGLHGVTAVTAEKIAVALNCSVKELTGAPSMWLQFMKTCRRLSDEQLQIVHILAAGLLRKPRQRKV